MDHPTLPKLLVASYPFRLSSDLSKSSSSPDLIYLCRGLRGQTHVFYNGKQALVNRRSTVSFHTPMKLGKHDGGLHRCNSAPRLLQVEPGVHGRFDEAGDGEKGVTRSPDLLAINDTISDAEPRRDGILTNGQNKLYAHRPYRDISFRPSSTSSLHFSMSSDRPNMSHIRRYGSLNDIDRGNRPYRTDHEKFSTKANQANEANQANQANQMLNVTNRPGDSNHSNELKIETDARSTSESDDGLTLVELQAIGAFVPLHNSHNNGEVTGEQSNTTRSIDQPSNGGVCMAGMQEHCVESRSWRADVRRVFHRSGGASNDFSAKTPSRRKFAAHNRPRRPAPTMPRGVDPQIARLKKRPSLFLRLLDRTLKQKNHSHVGYERITGTTGVFRWVDSVFKRTAVLIPLRAPGGEPSLALVDELRRYFGSDEITKQLLMLTSNAKGNDFIHHPINLYLLDRRQLKQERERNFEGRPPPRSNRSYLSLRNSRLCSSSGIRNFNRQGNNWKLLEFSKVANPDIGDGQLSFADLSPGLLTPTSLPRSATKRYASMRLSAGPMAIPIRRSSKNCRTVSMPKSMRRTSASTIGWAASIKEFEGDVGSVQVSGERMIEGDPLPATRSNKWSYVDPEDLPLSELADYSNILEGLESDTSNSPVARGPEETSNVHPPPETPHLVVASGQWIGALQMMQEYEDEAHKKSKRGKRPRTISKSSRSSSNPEGYVDQELREACRMALMSASALEHRRRSGTVNERHSGVFDAMQRYR